MGQRCRVELVEPAGHPHPAPPLQFPLQAAVRLCGAGGGRPKVPLGQGRAAPAPAPQGQKNPAGHTRAEGDTVAEGARLPLPEGVRPAEGLAESVAVAGGAREVEGLALAEVRGEALGGMQPASVEPEAPLCAWQDAAPVGTPTHPAAQATALLDQAGKAPPQDVTV
jgi:hypothetical protein